ncbi:uncharacterized protein SPPG_00003 [Spizellomyces punctatus DAOM BR117]|uniref:Transferase n=1 Tax=Spizellomyces punctatus (strain DAOM BR117) TaxID=645134 RepID=A0A0L0HT48_SPIPD|nr:uncharacterized protein SPPG_00003 [Spizellomyces punctatus DAOM BR117]KND04267.1 hypothetical protein SPPG_00003 [Spizellomyces punctatus DAOM BR117]|eukprot:XP_016612306.1 hypothetical protein SPPG_00003 [Spizellomyces punctatus DAOM BR117]
MISIISEATIRPSVEIKPPGLSVNLTPLDLVVPKVYAALLLLFDDPSGRFSDHGAISSSLERALSEYPALAAELVEEKDAVPRLIFNNKGATLVYAQGSEEDFQPMVEGQFAPETIPPNLFPRGPFPKSGETVLAVQITLFPGSKVAVGFRRHHYVADLPAFLDFIYRWSELHGKTSVEVQEDLICIQQKHLVRDLANLVEIIQPAPSYVNHEYRLSTGEEDTGMTRKPEPIYGKQFILDSEALANLKEYAHLGLNDGSWVSTNDAVAALFWRAVSRARELEQNGITKLGLAVNGRERIKALAPESKGYFGNFITGLCVSHTVDNLLTQPLGTTALMLRQAIRAHSPERIRSSVDYLLSLDPATELPLLRTSHTEVFGDDVAVTQWSKYPFYEAEKLHFGTGNCPFLVSPGSTVGDGVIVIIPAAPGRQGIEVMVGLTALPMKRLVMDAELVKFTKILG